MFERVLIIPVVTEKSQELSKERKYVFLVYKNANKDMVKKLLRSCLM